MLCFTLNAKALDVALIPVNIVRNSSWKCIFCEIYQEYQQNIDQISFHLDVGCSADGDVAVVLRAMRCLNPHCNKLSIEVIKVNNVIKKVPCKKGFESFEMDEISFGVSALEKLMESKSNEFPSSHVFGFGCKKFRLSSGSNFDKINVIPKYRVRKLPDFIPELICIDYSEAWAIVDLSPKAAATLARRCLQGMIRDFCKISKGTLLKEIEELERVVKSGSGPAGVTIESVEAIDCVRRIGNIGAHMEKDINNIVGIESGEAELLLEIVKMLSVQWYVERNGREIILNKVKDFVQIKNKIHDNGV